MRRSHRPKPLRKTSVFVFAQPSIARRRFRSCALVGSRVHGQPGAWSAAPAVPAIGPALQCSREIRQSPPTLQIAFRSGLWRVAASASTPPITARQAANAPMPIAQRSKGRAYAYRSAKNSATAGPSASDRLPATPPGSRSKASSGRTAEHAIHRLRLARGEYSQVERSSLIELGATELAQRIDWP